jgi:xanthine dehydrogenase accessory factor
MNMIARVNELLKKGDLFCMATVLESEDPNLPPGSKAIIFEDGTIEGDLQTILLEPDLGSLAAKVLKENKRRIVDFSDKIRIFIDILCREAQLIVCGAGHIAISLASFACNVGFNVTVLDDRSDFAQPSRFPNCKVIAENFTIALRDMSFGSSTYVVIITRGHEHDVDCLAEILQKETAYVGLIGSRRRVRFVLEWLEKKGFSQQRLKEVFTPIGIPIGAESPEEIALSIASELVCVRRKGDLQARALRAVVGMDS